MIRTQIQLTEEQNRRLKAISRRKGVSLAELVRASVDGLLAREDSEPTNSYARASRLVGYVRDPDGATDLALEHDRYLDTALE